MYVCVLWQSPHYWSHYETTNTNDMIASMPSSPLPMWHFCLQQLTCKAMVLNIKRLPAQTILRTVTPSANVFCRCNGLLYMTGQLQQAVQK